MDLYDIASKALTIGLPALMAVKEGVLKSVGSDAWKIIKKVFNKDGKDKKIIESLEKNPEDLKVQGMVELRLYQLLEEHNDIAKELINLLEKKDEFIVDKTTIEISNSKNVVLNNSINTQGGAFRVGDDTNYGKWIL